MTQAYPWSSTAALRALDAWKAAHDGSYQYVDMGQVMRLQRGLCYLCADPFVRECNHDQERSREHVFPRAAGGSRHANVLWAHRACNTAKADRWPTACEVLHLAAVYNTPMDHHERQRRLARAARHRESGTPRRTYLNPAFA